MYTLKLIRFKGFSIPQIIQFLREKVFTSRKEKRKKELNKWQTLSKLNFRGNHLPVSTGKHLLLDKNFRIGIAFGNANGFGKADGFGFSID